MASKKEARRQSLKKMVRKTHRTCLRKGDMVIVIGGGNSAKRPIKGCIGRILGFCGAHLDRVLVEGVNMVTRHKRQSGPGKPSGKIRKEASIHISNVMYYVEKLKKPVRLHRHFLEDGTKVRGYWDREAEGGKKKFVQI